MQVQLEVEAVESQLQPLVKGPFASKMRLWELPVPMETGWALHLGNRLIVLSQMIVLFLCHHVLDSELVGPSVSVTASSSVEILAMADNAMVPRIPALSSRHILVAWGIWVVSLVEEHFEGPHSSDRSPPARDDCTWGSNSH